MAKTRLTDKVHSSNLQTSPTMTDNHQQQNQPTNDNNKKKILLLHGSRQTGQLLLGRMQKLRKKLEKQLNVEIVPIDAPFAHPDSPELKTWWQGREGNELIGLDVSLQRIQSVWNNQPSNFVGLLGFSQGARLVHLLTTLDCLPHLQFCVLVAGYDAPLPEHISIRNNINIASLHVWGTSDALITSAQSRDLLKFYLHPQHYVHEGGHHVPMRAEAVRTYVDFIESILSQSSAMVPLETTQSPPNEECLQQQSDELLSLRYMFPDDLQMLTRFSQPNADDEDTVVYEEFPIAYTINLASTDQGVWPPHPLQLLIRYPVDYPDTASPIVRIQDGTNNGLEFSSRQKHACLETIQGAIVVGTPCILDCLYAAKDFFETSQMNVYPSSTGNGVGKRSAESNDTTSDTDCADKERDASVPRPVSELRIQECSLEGLQLAEQLLQRPIVGKGGAWHYTIGLVGKPSAGKSTFFNTATGFARQRHDGTDILGANMAPHPFTTIDPNVGYCLVPAPLGSCPEENLENGSMEAGSTHGRDALGRRLLPVFLKDVAGLVPGAYQGRGRGNQFLNDLTDADVLIHVLDATGMSDSEGNVVATSQDDRTNVSHPIHDMAWIRQELVEWVYSNLLQKWSVIQRKGKTKLTGMFSGYGQGQSVTLRVLDSVEQFLQEEQHRERPLENLSEWDTGDVHRLVSAFLGTRFPIALALNKVDVEASRRHVDDIVTALPVHGTHAGTPLSARNEMLFVRKHFESNTDENGSKIAVKNASMVAPKGTWQCLQSAMCLREPVVVFPVDDIESCSPIPAMAKYAVGDPSLPNPGMVACLEAAGGRAPSCWDKRSCVYKTPAKGVKVPVLRDALMMKPGSTVEDVFVTLKNMGALVGEFIRAEATSDVGVPSKPVPKHQLLSRSICILKIMTNKRVAWQSKG